MPLDRLKRFQFWLFWYIWSLNFSHGIFHCVCRFFDRTNWAVTVKLYVLGDRKWVILESLLDLMTTSSVVKFENERISATFADFVIPRLRHLKMALLLYSNDTLIEKNSTIPNLKKSQVLCEERSNRNLLTGEKIKMRISP